MELHKLPHPGTLLFPSLYLDCLPQWCSYYKWSDLSWGISLQTKDAFCCESHLHNSTERPHCPQRGSRAATCDCPSSPWFCCNQHWTSKKKCFLKVLLRSNLGICFWLHISKIYVKVTYRAKFGVQIWSGSLFICTAIFVNVLPPLLDSKNDRE